MITCGLTLFGWVKPHPYFKKVKLKDGKSYLSEININNSDEKRVKSPKNEKLKYNLDIYDKYGH
jgi:hypothetical protein